MDSRFQITKGLKDKILKPGFHISKSRILDSTGKYLLDSGFYEQMFPGLRNPDYLIWVKSQSIQMTSVISYPAISHSFPDVFRFSRHQINELTKTKN